MEKTKTKVSNEQGSSQAGQFENITIDQVKKWLALDLGSAAMSINAILSDPDILNQVAMFLHGKFENEQARKKLDIQEAINAHK